MIETTSTEENVLLKKVTLVFGVGMLILMLLSPQLFLRGAKAATPFAAQDSHVMLFIAHDGMEVPPGLPFVVGVLPVTGLASGSPQQGSPCLVRLLADSSPSCWPQGVTVKVNIDPAYTDQERNALEDAFNQWKTGANSMGANINFTFSFLTTPTVGPGNPGDGQRRYQVSKHTPPGGGVTQGQGATGSFGTEAGGETSAYTYLDPGLVAAGGRSLLKDVMSHEIGHTFGLSDCSACPQGSDPMTIPPTYNDDGGLPGPTPCDLVLLNNFYSLNSGTCLRQTCQTGWWWNADVCFCQMGVPPPSPIIVDIDGRGFHLTDAQHGVLFNLGAGVGNTRLKVGWPAARGSSTNAFLVLDRNGNGAIDDGTELFGNVTPQPASSEPRNGFIALAEYDKPENGGNNNHRIDPGDAIFKSLRLWQDFNHDGITQTSELYTLAHFGIYAIGLEHQASNRRDESGNEFRFRGQIYDQHGGPDVGKFIWDVFVVVDPTHSINGTSTDLVFRDMPQQ